MLGPPSCGKSTFLKLLSGTLHNGNVHGEITYNGMTADCGQFLLPKLAAYIDELDEHIANLTVQETFEFAWRAATGGHHSYLVSSSDVGRAVLDNDDAELTRVS